MNRQPTECWTRTMGYFRPISSMNIGKKSEHISRKYFQEQVCTSNELFIKQNGKV